MHTTLAGKTIFISGGSRGIWFAIAMRAARDGANVAIAGASSQPDLYSVSILPVRVWKLVLSGTVRPDIRLM